MIAGSLLTIYGGYKLAKYKTSEPNMPDGERTLAGAAILFGISGLAYKFIW